MAARLHKPSRKDAMCCRVADWRWRPPSRLGKSFIGGYVDTTLCLSLAEMLECNVDNVLPL